MTFDAVKRGTIDRRTIVATALVLPLAAPLFAKGTTMPSRFEQFSAVITAWKRRDIPAVLAAMTDDIVWHTAAGQSAPLVGKAAAGAFLEKFSADIAAVRWRIFEHAETADRLFVEGVDEFDTKAGVTVLAPYAGVIEYRGALISSWRDYFDRATMNASREGKVAPYVKELIGRPVAQ